MRELVLNNAPMLSGFFFFKARFVSHPYSQSSSTDISAFRVKSSEDSFASMISSKWVKDVFVSRAITVLDCSKTASKDSIFTKLDLIYNIYISRNLEIH